MSHSDKCCQMLIKFNCKEGNHSRRWVLLQIQCLVIGCWWQGGIADLWSPKRRHDVVPVMSASDQKMLQCELSMCVTPSWSSFSPASCSVCVSLSWFIFKMSCFFRCLHSLVLITFMPSCVSHGSSYLSLLCLYTSRYNVILQRFL